MSQTVQCMLCHHFKPDVHSIIHMAELKIMPIEVCLVILYIVIIIVMQRWLLNSWRENIG